VLCGTPFLANSQSAPLYPLHWLLYLPGAEDGVAVAVRMGWLAWLHLSIAGIGAYLLARDFQCRPCAARIAGTAFMLSGFCVAWLELPSFISVTCWIPFVPATTEAGCLQVLPASHENGFPGFGLAPDGQRQVPDSELERALARGDGPFSCELEPGDVLLFDACMFHRSLPNVGDYVRWSIDIRFCRPDVGLVKGGPGYVCHSAAGSPPARRPSRPCTRG
jgi:hypothetical protein